MKNKEKYLENRKILIAMSQPLQLLVKEGAINSVNEGLKKIYMSDNPTIKEFNTFNQWREKGKTIAKGSHAFLFWGAPKDKEQQQVDEKSSEEEKKMRFFPLAYLFANTQIKER